MDPSYSGIWKLQTKYQYSSAFPIDQSLVRSVGLFMGGYSGSGAVNIVDKIIVETAGNATDFGDTSVAKYVGAGFGSDTRSIIAGGYASSGVNVIEYFTFASAGNATDFGDLSAAAYGCAGISNNTRGMIALGYTSGYVNTVEYVTIASTGNATDFGDLTNAVGYSGSGGSST